jgi:hypothetical protein
MIAEQPVVLGVRIVSFMDKGSTGIIPPSGLATSTCIPASRKT